MSQKLAAIRKTICDKCHSHCGMNELGMSIIGNDCPIGMWNVIRRDFRYTKKLPCNNENKLIEEQGPKLWAMLHGRALAYECKPIEEIQWLKAFEAMLPCGKCRKHWRGLIKGHPPRLNNSEDYFSWTVEMHNKVNTSKDKPTSEITLQQARDIWFDIGSKPNGS